MDPIIYGDEGESVKIPGGGGELTKIELPNE